MNPERWPDDRLDELNRRLVELEREQKAVVGLAIEMRGVQAAMRDLTEQMAKLARKMTEVVTEPMVRGRDFRKQLYLGFAAAVFGGLMTTVTIVILGASK